MKLARFWLVCLFFLLWACAIVARLFWLQIVRHNEYVERAQKQQQRTFEVAPRRGILYDRNLHELAMTVQVDSIYADPTEIDDKRRPHASLAAIVQPTLKTDRPREDQIRIVSTTAATLPGSRAACHARGLPRKSRLST